MNTRRLPKSKGFTLIELLVVIAIIGLLSAVVLAALNSARVKGKDAAIKSEVLEMRTLLNEEYSDNSSYAALWNASSVGTGGWISNSTDCSAPVSGYTGTYGPQAKQICNSIVANETAGNCAGGTTCLYQNPGYNGTNNTFTIMAWLPGAQQYICVGSSGNTSLNTTAAIQANTCAAGAYCGAGCYGNQ